MPADARIPIFPGAAEADASQHAAAAAAWCACAGCRGMRANRHVEAGPTGWHQFHWLVSCIPPGPWYGGHPGCPWDQALQGSQVGMGPITGPGSTPPITACHCLLRNRWAAGHAAGQTHSRQAGTPGPPQAPAASAAQPHARPSVLTGRAGPCARAAHAQAATRRSAPDHLQPEPTQEEPDSCGWAWGPPSP